MGRIPFDFCKSPDQMSLKRDVEPYGKAGAAKTGRSFAPDVTIGVFWAHQVPHGPRAGRRKQQRAGMFHVKHLFPFDTIGESGSQRIQIEEGEERRCRASQSNMPFCMFATYLFLCAAIGRTFFGHRTSSPSSAISERRLQHIRGCMKVSGKYPLSSPARPRVRGTSGASLKSRCREGVVPRLCALAPFLSEIMGADERSPSEAPCPLS